MGLGFAGVFLLTLSLAAANSDVADAAMRKVFARREPFAMLRPAGRRRSP
jgi:hypothetical protein